MIPDFLRNAKQVGQSSISGSTEQTPSFLQNAKQVARNKNPAQKMPFEGENDLEREIERNQAQLTSRGIESIAGLPGDLYSFTKSLFGFEPETNLPTSQSLREFSESASQGYTKPRNEFEEKAGEIFSDIATMALPGAGTYGLTRNLGIPIVSNLVQEGLKYSGSEEKNASAAKIGTMVALDLLAHRKGGARKYAGDLFQRTKSMIPETAEMSAQNLEKSLKNLRTEFAKGGEKASTIKPLKKINEILGEIKEGKINVKNLYEYRPSINEAIEELGGFDVNVPKSLKRKMIRNLNSVKSEVIKGVESGLQGNPEALKTYRNANEAWSAYENSNKMTKFIEKTVGSSIKSPLLKAVLGLSAPIASGLTAGPLATGLIGSMAFGGYQAFKILNQITNSKTLRKYYGNILKGAAVGNSGQVKKNVKALDQKLSEQESSSEDQSVNRR